MYACVMYVSAKMNK